MMRMPAAPAARVSKTWYGSVTKSLRMTGRLVVCAAVLKSDRDPENAVGSVRTETAAAPPIAYADTRSRRDARCPDSDASTPVDGARFLYSANMSNLSGLRRRSGGCGVDMARCHTLVSGLLRLPSATRLLLVAAMRLRKSDTGRYRGCYRWRSSVSKLAHKIRGAAAIESVVCNLQAFARVCHSAGNFERQACPKCERFAVRS